MRIGAIDIGTNSVLLLVAELREGELVPLVERAEITRLGQGVDRTRALAPDAVARTLGVLARYGEEMRALGVVRRAAVGTSAMRDAKGGAEFAAQAEALLDTKPQTISGRLEAELTFEGSLVGLPFGAGGAGGGGGAPSRALVFDVGGGSTELILGAVPVKRAHGYAAPASLVGGTTTIDGATSLDIGSVRLTERHVKSDPPTPAELEAVRADVRAALATVRFDVAAHGAPALVGVAGTVTTLGAFHARVDPYDAGRVHGLVLSVRDLEAACDAIARVTLDERRRLPGVEPKRADVLVAGSIIVLETTRWVSERTGRELPLLVSDRGVRWGLARRLATADAALDSFDF